MPSPLLVSLLLCALCLACDNKRQPTPSASASASALLPPLTARGWLEALPVPGAGAAEVSLPLGARSPRPVVVAIHGGDDRPEWQCGSYRHASRSQGFVLCPRGVPRAGGERFTLGSFEQSATELRAALRALKSRYGAHVAKEGLVLAGLGPGVEHALELAREEPSFFARLVLVDGSLARFSPALVTHYGQRGGKRVLVACGARCDPDIDAKLRSFRSAGVDARLLRVDGARGLDARMVERLRESWGWLVSGEARWR